MAFINFLRSTQGRAFRVAVGFALIAYGGTHVSLAGLVLMMVGMVPAVTGLAEICLLEEVVTSREAPQATQGRPGDDRAYAQHRD